MAPHDIRRAAVALGDRLKHTQLIVVATASRTSTCGTCARRVGSGPGCAADAPTEEITWIRPASGLVTALDPVMRAWGGTWVAHGSGNARSRSVRRERPRAGPARPAVIHAAPRLADAGRGGRLLLRAVPTARSGRCATSRTRVRSSTSSDWEAYSRVNRRFAETVLEEIGTRPAIVFVQDYHFALLPRFIKDARPDVDRLSVLAHSVAERRGVPHLSRGAKRSCTGCSATICCRFTSSSTATTFSRPSSRRSKRGSTTSGSRWCAAATRRWCKPFADQHRSRAVGGADQAAPIGRRNRDDSPQRSASAASASSSASIGSTTPRAFPTASAPSSACSRAIPNGGSAWCSCRSARRAAISLRALPERSARKSTRP